MTPVEKIKELYSSPYDVKKLGEFQRIMMESIEAYEEVLNHIDIFNRNTDEFQIITRYHTKSYRVNKEYKEQYGKVVKKLLEEGKRDNL